MVKLRALAVYWTAWGWRFALGFVVSIYIHEMGHVAALQLYGIKATAPMFGVVTAARAIEGTAPAKPDGSVIAQFVVPVFALSALSATHVPGIQPR